MSTEALSTYTRIAVMLPLDAVAPAEMVTGEETVAPFAGAQIFAPGPPGKHPPPPPPEPTVKLIAGDLM